MLAGLVIYGWLLFASLSNALLMKRPKAGGKVDLEFMIPARNEAERIATALAPLLNAGARVTVYDDGSEDGTCALASDLGATVISGSGQLPEGWRGKPHACHQLASQSTAEWVVFLDADTLPAACFVEALEGHLAACAPSIGAVTGFPKMLPGRLPEPIYLFWVPFILLATNPFGLVSRSHLGHNFFLNGQVIAWRQSVLQELRPYELAKNQVLDDVFMGRYLARKRIKVEVLNLTEVLSVQMYRNLEEALAGMSKNTVDIVPGRGGAFIFALMLTALALLWVTQPWLGIALILAALAVNRVVRFPWWVPLLVPFSLLAGAYTALRSRALRARGLSQWKGRVL